MENTHLRYTVERHVATVTLDRPEALNALSQEMSDGLIDATASASSSTPCATPRTTARASRRSWRSESRCSGDGSEGQHA